MISYLWKDGEPGETDSSGPLHVRHLIRSTSTRWTHFVHANGAGLREHSDGAKDLQPGGRIPGAAVARSVAILCSLFDIHFAESPQGSFSRSDSITLLARLPRPVPEFGRRADQHILSACPIGVHVHIPISPIPVVPACVRTPTGPNSFRVGGTYSARVVG